MSVRTLILPVLALATISAAVGAAVAVFAVPPAIGTQRAVPRYALSESTGNPPIEQVAAKVLPSVVTSAPSGSPAAAAAADPSTERCDRRLTIRRA
jgi:hypothetical protein